MRKQDFDHEMNLRCAFHLARLQDVEVLRDISNRELVQKCYVISGNRTFADSMIVNKRTMRIAKNFDRKEND